jgi:hypothetical protein
MDETAVFRLTEDLPAGSQIVVKAWPSAALTPMARWHAATRPPGESRWSPPLEIVRVEAGT